MYGVSRAAAPAAPQARGIECAVRTLLYSARVPYTPRLERERDTYPTRVGTPNMVDYWTMCVISRIQTRPTVVLFQLNHHPRPPLPIPNAIP